VVVPLGCSHVGLMLDGDGCWHVSVGRAGKAVGWIEKRRDWDGIKSAGRDGVLLIPQLDRLHLLQQHFHPISSIPMIPSVFSAPLPIATKEAEKASASQTQTSSSETQTQTQTSSSGSTSSQQGGGSTSSAVRSVPLHLATAETMVPVTPTPGHSRATNPDLHFPTSEASRLDPAVTSFVPQAEQQEWQAGSQGAQPHDQPSYTGQPSQDQSERRGGN